MIANSHYYYYFVIFFFFILLVQGIYQNTILQRSPRVISPGAVWHFATYSLEARHRKFDGL